ncbi:hypothetical protein [Austwickia chelonae]|uniref:hypothetical protein n=1 Tax=Austwickia chelonae TaxID=100225 RepID=UPI000E22009B|nr:hypothetical protein [Austwickia chelonae]
MTVADEARTHRAVLSWSVEHAARRRLTGWATWSAWGALFLACAAIAAMLHLSAATRLSPAQQNLKALGSYERSATISIGTCDSSRCPIAAAMTEAVQHSGGRSPLVTLHSGTIRTDIPGIGAVTPLEAHWAQAPLPERYRLVSGRWPTATGEAALPNVLAGALPDNGKLPVYGGADIYTVVGTIEDVYARDARDLFVAPGTIDRTLGALQKQGNRFSRPEIIATVHYHGGDAAALHDALADRINRMTGIDRGSLRSNLEEQQVQARPTHVDWAQKAERFSLLTEWIPLIGIPLLAGFTANLITLGRDRRGNQILAALGAPTTMVVLVGSAISLAATALITALGALVGDRIGILLRPVVEATANQPLSPPLPPGFLILIITSAGLTGVVGRVIADLHGLWRLSGHRLRLPSGRFWARLFTGLQYVTLIAGSAWLFSAITRGAPATTRETEQRVLTVCLLLSIVTGMLLSWLQDSKGVLPLPLNLALRRLHRTPALTAATVTVTMLCTSMPISLGISRATSEYYIALTQVSSVAPGQVTLGYAHVYRQGVPPRVRADFEKYTGLGAPVSVYGARVSSGKMQGLPLVVDSAHDVERLVGHPLTPAQSAAFTRGEILVFDSPKNEIKEDEILQMEKNSEEKPTPTRATLIGDIPEAYSHEYLGVASAEQARRDRWHLDTRYWVYTDVGAAQNAAALKAPHEQRFDPLFVHVHTTPKTVPIPPSVKLAGKVLGGLLAALTLALTIGHVTAFRPYRRSLQAIGVRTRLLTVTVAAAVLVAVAVPITIGHTVAAHVTQFILSSNIEDPRGALVPWEDVQHSLALCLGLVLASLIIGLLVDLLRKE